MSTAPLMLLREKIAARMVEEGVCTADAIIIKRETDIWNDIARAVASRKVPDRTAWVIGITEGAFVDDTDIVVDLTIPITSFCPITLEKGAAPEEEKWHTMLHALHGWDDGQHCNYELKVRSFNDGLAQSDGRPAWHARETIFTIRHHIPKPTTP
ncbi:hypothetical protein OVA24_06235 [Luteolibacter sp. SL250]|uniref:hypothetical protein n=1 Tax=Luteolibacter sp. SL250 TaxID=2995170 RepID=UPI00226F7439|nr:hypothetical protein [Luteolibacter sp. SL250]WAC20979.1 hypothetical protein OVA24_06235 [Luteolibacter sp. SL250]